VTERKAGKPKTDLSKRERREARQTARRVFLDPSTPSMRSIVRVVLITLLLIAVFDFAKSILASLTKLFFVIVLAVFFAYLMDPLVKLIRSPFKVRQLERFMPRALAIVIAYVLVFTVLGIAISNLAPILTNQARTLEKSLPGYAASMQQTLNQISARFSRLRLPENLQQDVSTRISNYLGETATNFGSILTSLPWLLLVPILAFFFLKDVNLYRVSILRLVPSGKWRTRVEKVLFDVNKTLAAYTRAQIISCVFIGLVCTVGFTVIGLDYAILLGILAGVFEFVPLIGPLSIAILATTLAFLESPWQAVYTASFLIILRLVHDYITYPRIIREGIHLHPLAVILSVLAGEQVAGIPGVFISIPVVALLTVLYKHVIEHSTALGFFGGWFESRKEEENAAENI
jgi:predicted PurR-regulated permease PerM